MCTALNLHKTFILLLTTFHFSQKGNCCNCNSCLFQSQRLLNNKKTNKKQTCLGCVRTNTLRFTIGSMLKCMRRQTLRRANLFPIPIHFFYPCLLLPINPLERQGGKLGIFPSGGSTCVYLDEKCTKAMSSACRPSITYKNVTMAATIFGRGLPKVKPQTHI